ncbi:cytochrome P450 [Novosphingobium sp.]|uniref:cytochrome P450 n=1 Tax=Novosphingobium sp. TaxID=1874826 RepID=UPI002625A433|nr:cytochrome P450 [Novosphingobium sp.]
MCRFAKPGARDGPDRVGAAFGSFAAVTVEEALATAGRRLLDPAAPALERCVAAEDPKSAVRVFVAARHDVVSGVLCEEAVFSLRHYDDLLEQVLPGTRYLVGENDAARQVRLRQLHTAQGWLDAERSMAATQGEPNMAPGFRAWVAAMAREEAAAILDVLQRRASTGEPVNFVRDYAFLIAWRMARRIIGVPAPDAVPGLVRLMVFARNVMHPGPALRLKDELGDAAAMLLMQQALFGHVFGTVVNSKGWMRWLARKTATPALDAIDAALALPEVAPHDSLVSALAAVKPQFSEVPDYDLQARSVLFELTGALVLIVGKSLSEMAAFACSPEGARAGIGWDRLVSLLADPGASQQAHDATINEALRLTGGSRLTRTVRNNSPWRGVDLQAGDRVVVLIDAASRDPAAFPDPGRFAPDPARPYITSGPLQGPHLCYGRGIAWTILREAIAATQGRIAPVGNAQMALFAGLPDDLPFIASRRQI